MVEYIYVYQGRSLIVKVEDVYICTLSKAASGETEYIGI